MNERAVLQLPLGELCGDDRFLLGCATMGFCCLEEILVLSPAELTGRAGFSYDWLGRLVKLLETRGLLHLLQSTPGRTPG